jgi:hypothetical protein
MKNPVEIEKHYQELLSIISYPTSPRVRLLRIKDFVDELMYRPEESESYLLEVLQQLPEIVQKLDIAGIEPYIMRSLYEDLIVLHAHHPSLSDIAGFEQALDTLRLMTAQLYAFVGNIRVMLAFLNPGYADTPPRWIHQVEPEPLPNCFELLQHVWSVAEENEDTVALDIAKFIDSWTRYLSDPNNAAVVPVIEFSYSTGQVKQNYGGSLRKIQVRIIGETKDRYDDIHPDIAVYGARPPVEYSMNLPVLAARNLVKRTHSHLANRNVAGHIKFDNRYALHEGSSANAAIAASVYCNILNRFGQRTTYRLSPGIAITGNLNEEGNIVSVDQQTLEQKVRAVFFSYLNILVVPKQQLHHAEYIAERLAEYYPERKITIIGIRHLRDIFYDRRLTERETVNRTLFIGKRLLSRKNLVASLVSILILLIVIARLLYGPLDQNPVYGEYQGESLVIFNGSHQVIDRIPVNRAVISMQESITQRSGETGNLVTFTDITDDGRNEVIWVDEVAGEEITTWVIYCKSIRRDDIIWSYPVYGNLKFPNKPYADGDRYIVNKLLVDDFDATGKPALIVLAAHHHFFPGLVLRLDPGTGERIGHYVHTGRLLSAFTADITGNGRKELIAGGVNNAFEEAVIVVLDVDLLDGHSPLQGEYMVEGYTPAREIGYVRIPRTIVGQRLRHKTRYNFPSAMFHNPEARQFKIETIEFQDQSAQETLLTASTAKYYVTFDYDLNVKMVGTADGYDVMARLLWEEGNIEAVPDYNYFLEYAKTFKYWNGSDWQNEPVINTID